MRGHLGRPTLCASEWDCKGCQAGASQLSWTELLAAWKTGSPVAESQRVTWNESVQ